MSNDATITALPIPAKYAGLKLADIKDSIVIEKSEDFGSNEKNRTQVLTIDGQRYSIQSGYLVPYYVNLSSDFSKRAEELTLDRVRRFFYTAEPELDVRWTREQIQRALAEYRACNDPDLKEIKARYVVGHIVNRIERLARIYFHANLDSGETSLSDEQKQGLLDAQQPLADLQAIRRARQLHGNTEDAQKYNDLERPLILKIRKSLKPIRDEVLEYVQLLIHEDKELIDAVRRRDRSTDHDGILVDLIRETAKVWDVENLSAERLAREGILQKIGESMSTIDETSAILEQLLGNTLAMNSLRQAKEKYAGTLKDNQQAIQQILDGGALKTLREFTQVCRARVGVRSEDCDNFGYLRERAALIDDVVHEIHKNLRSIGRETQEVRISELRDLLSDGFNLMYDTSQVRIPRNNSAPSEKPDRLTMNSVARLKTRAEEWLNPKQRGQSEGQTP